MDGLAFYVLSLSLFLPSVPLILVAGVAFDGWANLPAFIVCKWVCGARQHLFDVHMGSFIWARYAIISGWSST